ncbi:MAG: hypothetical protein IMY73_01555 [Bacteroidetes bacterium]|nr:hypothetical protein [Bacteroidota bacterium]
MKNIIKVIVYIGIFCINSFFTNVYAQISYDYNFESGAKIEVLSDSLVYSKDTLQYRDIVLLTTQDLQNPNDTLAYSSSRWFYFKMRGVKGDSLNVKFKGSDSERAFYSYDNKNFIRFSEDEYSEVQIRKRFTKDSVYIAYFKPYTFTKSREKIEEWLKHKCVDTINIGYSYKGLPLTVVKITDNRYADSLKKVVWIQSRVHPSESPASFWTEGFVERLFSENNLLRKAVFYIIPMCNPDGVYGGYSRSDSRGVNHEGNYNSDSLTTSVEVKAIKKYFSLVQSKNKGVSMFLNIHAQVANKSSYWIHSAESSSQYLFRKKLLMSYFTSILEYKSRGVDGYNDRRDKVPEGWIWKNWGDSCVAITFELPYAYYCDTEFLVTPENLKNYGSKMVDVVANFLDIRTSQGVIIDDIKIPTRRCVWKRKKLEEDGLLYGKTYLTSKRRKSRLEFEITELEEGEWRCYEWIANPQTEKQRRENERDTIFDNNYWHEVGTYEVEADKVLNVKFTYHKGEVVDAFLFRKKEKEVVYN